MPSVTTDRRRGINSSAAIKVACIAASTANLTLSGEQTVDAIALVAGDRCFAKDQTDATEVGIYQVSTSDWQREPDFDGSYDVQEGTLVPVSRGAANANTYWKITNTGDITIGTTEITVIQGLVDIGIAATVTTTDESADTTCFPTFVTAATGDLAQKTDSQLVYNSATGQLGSTINNVIGITDATSKTTGASKNAGGAGIVKTVWVGQDIVLDERADHASTPAAGIGIVWVNNTSPSSIMFTDDTGVDHSLTSPIVGGHIRAGNTQIPNGDTALSKVNVESTLAKDAWESIGPTSSGADNIWNALDNLPSNARIVIVDLRMELITVGTALERGFIYAVEGGVSSPTKSEPNNLVLQIDYDPSVAADQSSVYVRTQIPLNGSQVFKMLWEESGAATPVIDISMTYRGFMTD